jgi:16S rRNA pseudouridine516 synthase
MATLHNLERLLARNLGRSRSDVRRLLAAQETELPTKLAPSELPYALTIAEQTIWLHDAFHLMLNKPAGCITALSDPEHATAAAYVDEAPLFAELRPVGRLDLETTGLLLWTTDGNWLHRLTHPRTAVPRSYHVALARPFEAAPSDLVLRDGHRPTILDLRERRQEDMHASLQRPSEPCCYASITIAGGAYHEVRRIFAALGSHVLSLCRVSFGKLQLPAELEPGFWQQIQKDDVESK